MEIFNRVVSSHSLLPSFDEETQSRQRRYGEIIALTKNLANDALDNGTYTELLTGLHALKGELNTTVRDPKLSKSKGRPAKRMKSSLERNKIKN